MALANKVMLKDNAHGVTQTSDNELVTLTDWGPDGRLRWVCAVADTGRLTRAFRERVDAMAERGGQNLRRPDSPQS